MGDAATPPVHGVRNLSTARLHTIRLESLIRDDESESWKLFDACLNDGIFYIDFSGTNQHDQEVTERLYTLERELFLTPEEELLKFDIDKLFPKKMNGYKPLGRNRGGLAGEKDGFQSYALSKNSIMRLGGESAFEHPEVVMQTMPALRTFTRLIATAAGAILSALSDRLQLASDEDLRKIHPSHLSTPDIVRLLKYPARPPWERGYSHIPHTDMGSLTFLFTKQYGLQIPSRDQGTWQWVEPRKDCAVVNVGDCLSFLTNKTLRACTHRVFPLPEASAEDRYSFAYLMRPDEAAPMKPVTSSQVAKTETSNGKDMEPLSCGEWMRRKYAILRGDSWKEDEDWILTGA